MSLKFENKETLEKMRIKAEVYSVCMQNTSVEIGDVFGGVRLAKNCTKFDFSNQKVCVHGIAYEDELLVSAKEQRYFFTLGEGWGVKDGYLYGVSLCRFMDFGRSVTREEIRKMVEKPLKKQGVYARMGEAMEKERMKAILKVMNHTEKGELL